MLKLILRLMYKARLRFLQAKKVAFSGVMWHRICLYKSSFYCNLSCMQSLHNCVVYASY